MVLPPSGLVAEAPQKAEEMNVCIMSKTLISIVLSLRDLGVVCLYPTLTQPILTDKCRQWINSCSLDYVILVIVNAKVETITSESLLLIPPLLSYRAMLIVKQMEFDSAISILHFPQTQWKMSPSYAPSELQLSGYL